MENGTSYDAYLEGTGDGKWRARVLDLSGCWADGASEQQALVALAAALPIYFAWLRTHDDYTPMVAGPFTVRLCASHLAQSDQDRPIGAFFAPDALPVTHEELDWELALLGWAYDDAVAAVADLGHTPAADATVRLIVRAQNALLAALDPALAVADGPAAAGAATQSIEAFARAVLARLRGVTTEHWAAVREAAGETWSLRKVLRRSIELVREVTVHAAHAATSAG
jgi:predicted RNase H-like HicB family nuclease